MGPCALDELESVEVILTANCNLRCAYCYQNAKKPRSMSWDTLRGALDILLRSHSPEVAVVFLGGEPLLEFPLIRKAVAYVEGRRTRKKVVRFSLSTNGTLLGAEQARFLDRHRIDVQLSFDGVPESQRLRGRGTFEILDRLLGRLSADTPRLFRDGLTVHMTLTASTIPSLADSIAYFLGKGVAEISVGPVVTFDPGWTTDLLENLEHQFARAFVACVEHYRRMGEVPVLLFRLDGAPARNVPEGAMCRAPTGEVLAVDVDGHVYGCAAFAESYQKPASPFLRSGVVSMWLGDFRDPDFAGRLARYPQAARGLGIFHDKERKHSSFGRCADCRFAKACSVCPASIGHIPGNADPHRVPDFVCAFNRTALGWRALFPRPESLRGASGRRGRGSRAESTLSRR